MTDAHLASTAKAALEDLKPSAARVSRLAQRLRDDRHWLRHLERTPAPVAARSRGRVIVFAMIGQAALARPEASLALELARRGYDVEAVFCDATRPACELSSVAAAGRHDHLSRCSNCLKEVDRNWSRLSGRARVRHLSEVVDGPHARAAAADTGWTDGLDARAEHEVLVRILRRESVDHQDHPALALQLRQAAAMSAMAARALVDEGPIDHVFMSHGIYVSWAPARRVFEEAGIDIIFYDLGPRRGSLIADRYDRSSGESIVRREYEARWRQVPMTAEQSVKIDTYLASRRNPEKGEHPYSFGPQRSREELCERLRLDPARPIVVAFPNLLWDAASYGRNRLYDSVAMWIRETVRIAAEAGVQLVVRTHPAEAVRGTAESVQSVLVGAPGADAPGVVVLAPSDPTGTGSLQQSADLALVNTSTVGLECATLGLRVVTTADSHYTGLGFTVDPADRGEYEAVLRDAVHLSVGGQRSTEVMAAARHYAHYYFYRRPFMFRSDGGRDDLPWFEDPNQLSGLFTALDDPSLAPVGVR